MRTQNSMREWLSGGVSPCQGEGRGFESRLVLFLFRKSLIWFTVFLLTMKVLTNVYISCKLACKEI